LRPLLSLFTDGEIEAIGTATRRVLAQKGLRFVVPEVLKVFSDRGFQIVDGSVVRISSDELDAALRTAPRSFVRRGATPSRDVLLGDGETKFAVGSLPIWVVELEPQIRRRPATLDDFKRFTLLSEVLDGFAIGNPVVQPQEIPVEVMHVLWNRNNAVRMTKPACCWYGTSFETSQEGLELLRLAAGGMDALRSSKRWAITICPDSALQWGKSAIGAMVMAEGEVPVEVLPIPFLGSMHPVTMAGALVQSAAEVMAIVVLTQLVRPGCPVVYAASYGGVMDMASGSHSFGAPESALFGAASAAVGQAFGLTTDMMQGTSDSKLPDAQAALEKTMALLMPALAGADCVTMAGALLDFALSASYEQLLIDEEIVNSVLRIARGSLVNEETLAEREIMELPFGGHHLGSEHTYRNYRNELFFTKLADRRPWEAWWRDGGEDMPARARRQVARILASAQPVQGVPEENRQAVDRFAADICRRHGVDPEPLLY
jgi:trimethylamine--corrinoid protein Co-methyltransferase